MRCQEKTRAAEKVAWVTKVDDHPYGDRLVLREMIF